MSEVAAGDGFPIIQYWHSPEIPAEISALTSTFRDLNPDLRHLIFNEADAAEFIAKHFSAREVAAFRTCAVPAMQADYFRYCAVLTLGGIYSDVDARCLRSLSTLIEIADDGLLFRRRSNGNVINHLFLFREPRHPLPQVALDVATANIEQRVAEDVWWVTGPGIFTFLSGLRRLGSSDAAPVAVAQAKGGLARHLPLPAEQRKEWQERLANRMLEAAGGYGRIVDAFDGVRIESLDLVGDWIGGSGPLRYKEGLGNWVRWRNQGRTIFR